MANAGLSKDVLSVLGTSFASHSHIELVKLYGSRAKGTFTDRSDIDLAAFGSALTRSDIADVLLTDGTIALDNGYAPDADLDISTKKYVDDSIAAIDEGSGVSETELLTISTGTEKFSDGVSDTHQDDWNIRAKNKIESNTTSLGSKATQADFSFLPSLSNVKIITANRKVKVVRNKM